MNRVFVILAALLGFSLVFQACLKGEEYPPEPSLIFKELRTTGDSAIVRFDFTDGDGNFGLNQEDTSGVFDDCLRRYNMYLEYYEWRDGQWVQVPIDPCVNPDAVPFYYRIPFVEPTGQIKSQKGEIRIVITPFYYLPGVHDSCRFEAHIVDRAFNESQVVRTSVFRKP
jgi:hypothetical protein